MLQNLIGSAANSKADGVGSSPSSTSSLFSQRWKSSSIAIMSETTIASYYKVQKANDGHLSTLFNSKSHYRRENGCLVLAALPETAASVVVAAVAVGAAASLLSRTTKASDTSNSVTKTCEDCGGSGVCAECNGEGFVLKKMSEESVEKARLTAKNMATRYTAGLPKKWSYCSKCSSSRSCTTCGGTGRIAETS